MVWPAEKRSWSRRAAYVGPRRALEAVEPALAQGTGWAGGGRATTRGRRAVGRHSRSASGRPRRSGPRGRAPPSASSAPCGSGAATS